MRTGMMMQGKGQQRRGALGDDKKAPTNYSNVWAEARVLVWNHRRRMVIGAGLLLISRLTGFVLPYITGTVWEEVIQNKRMDALEGIAWIVAAATVVQAASTFALAQVMGVAAQRAITDMRKSIQEHVGRLPVNYFDTTQTGQLISRIMTDAEGIRNLVGNGLVQLFGGLITGTLVLAYLFYLNWTLTISTLVVLGLFGGMMAFAFRRLRPIFRERGKINAEVTGRLGEAIGGVRVIKAYRAEKREEVVFSHGAHRLFRKVASTITGVSAVNSFSGVIVGAIGLLIMMIGGRAVASNPPTMEVADLVRYIFFTFLLASPIIQVASIGTQISEAFAGLDRIREVKHLATEDEGDDERIMLKDPKGEISFEGVHFRYRPEVPVLKDVSFTAPAGSTTALVGPSGSGKSTLINLVMAFARPESGVVKIDGTDLSRVRLRDYRSRLGVVLQDNFLFDGTIAENVRFARPYATPEQIKDACRIAHCDEFIEEFPEKYETITGERGVKLSGGQRQRIAIARAILADPMILILDEATSSLDSESEAKIQDGLESLRKGRTTFVIAHRLSTIRSADQILVLDEGRIVERGSHLELFEKNGLYRKLHDKQYEWEKNRFINPGEDFTPAPARHSTNSSARSSQ